MKIAAKRRSQKMAVVAKRDGELYCWVYDDSRKLDVLRSLGKFASDPRLSFTWTDAARVANQVRFSGDET